ncbi:VanZ family protein [Georgenia sp. 10Sc9-8]|uniref:VanZ family protein n=1 Tax=Georgenia halotolerans TaxID=3028317 RepID=A0ABT5TVE8_9MICO|nr:VanZ family protein [Georgenia halotolerans]
MPTSRRRLWLALLGAALVGQLVGLYAPSAPDMGAPAVPGADKVAHVVMFAAVVLTALRAGLPPRWVLGLSLAHAVLSEVVQHELLPHRSGDLLDVVADVAGIVLGTLAARALSADERGRTGPAR